MWITTIVLLLGNLGLVAFILKRLAAKDKTQDELSALREIIANLEKALGEEVPRLETEVREEIRASQATTANTLTVQLRETADTLVGVVGRLGEAQTQHLGGVAKSIETTVNTLVKTVGELGETQTEELANVSNSVNKLTQTNETRIENVRNKLNEGLQALQKSNEDKLEQIRQSVNEQLQTTADTLTSTVGELGEAQTRQLETVKNSVNSTADTLVNTIGELGETQKRQLDSGTKAINELTQTNETRIEDIRNTLSEGFKNLQTSNENKLEQIRQSVNEQLHATVDTLTSTVGELGEAQTRQLETVKNSVDSTADTLVNTIGELGETQTRQLETVQGTINALTQTNETRIENVRNTLNEGLQDLQESNENKLERIRQSVNEQLHATVDTLTSTVGELGEAQTRQLETVKNSVDSTADTLVNTIGELGETQTRQLETVQGTINALTQTNETRIENVRNTLNEGLETLQTSNENKLEQIRVSVNEQLNTAVDTLVTTVGELGKTQKAQLDSGTKAINDLTLANETRIENVRNTLSEGLKNLQTSNENKLEQIRHTVDEQLQSTLERRIGESFKLVSTHLEAVQQGLGEMQNLATGVGDLKKVLTNVRARGTWGEVQLGALLEQVLTPDQYDTNVRIKEHSQEVVEFAIRLPGSDDQPGSYLWLPIDSKFPVEDYQRLIKASDAETERTATRDFIRGVEAEAKKIRDKYIAPPKTTDFAIMFMPTEGLYAEVLRQPGQVEKLQTRYRIVVAGPTTLTAILSSLRMGFQTLAIQQRSSEVWEVLAAVKTEFDKFGGVMTKLKRQLNAAANTVEETGVRTRAMERSLRGVEKLPPEVSAARLGFTLEEHTINGDNADE